MKRLADTPLAVLDLSPIIQGGTVADSFRNSVDLAQHAERLGYNRYWLAEHHNMPGIASAATSVLIGHVAGNTTTIRLGSGGIMLPNHSPLVIAEQFGTLEALYPGRIDLGLGRAPGTDGITSRALRRDPSAADDFPDQVSELLHFLGPAVDGQRVKAIPGVNTNVPVWLLGSSTFSAQLAAMMGLPFAFASHFAPRLLDQALQIYRNRFTPSAYLLQPYAMVGLPVIAAETDEEAHHLSTSAYQQILNLIRHVPTPVPPPVPTMDGRWSDAERNGVMDFFGEAIIGGPATVKAGLERIMERTQADELIIHSQFYRHEDRKRSYEIVAAAKNG